MSEVKITGLCFTGVIEEIGDGGPNNNPRIIVRDAYGNKIQLDCSENDCILVCHRLYDSVVIKFDAHFEFLD